jgi:hypothetical protein
MSVGLLFPRDARAAAILELNCILTENSCTPSASYGTVTLDQVGSGVSVSVDLAGTGQEFRDLLLTHGQHVRLSDTDPVNKVQFDTFRLAPSSDIFKIGVYGGNGWDGDDLYTTLLTAPGGLSLANFLANDGLLVALHIQNIGQDGCDGAQTINGTRPCLPGVTGTGSLKVGGTLRAVTTPEPSSLVLLGTGVLVAARRLTRRRRAS